MKQAQVINKQKAISDLLDKIDKVEIKNIEKN